jgi:RAB protein geranylgeranyltransferase component A
VASQVELMTVRDATTGQEQQVAHLLVRTPTKKPRDMKVTAEQKAINRTINTIRVRAEHCIEWAKNWAILVTQFRCSHAIDTSIRHVVCGLVNQQTARWQKAQRTEATYCAETLICCMLIR